MHYFMMRHLLSLLFFKSYQFFNYLLAFFFLHETLSLQQILLGLLLISGAFILMWDPNIKKVKLRILLLMTLSCLLISLNSLLFKVIAIETNFLTTIFWEYMGFTLVGVVVFVCVKSYREQFLFLLKENTIPVLGLNLLNELINIVAKMMVNFMAILLPIALASLTNALQPVFLLFTGIILSRYLPHLGQESLQKHMLFQKIGGITCICIGAYFLYTGVS